MCARGPFEKCAQVVLHGEGEHVSVLTGDATALSEVKVTFVSSTVPTVEEIFALREAVAAELGTSMEAVVV
eukprot:196223-Rhodomonas_salina.1